MEAIHTSLQEDITYEQLNNVNSLLNIFVSDVEKLYSLTAMTYNVHQLLHLVKSIEDWGPLWAHSAFSFESANYKLLCSIQCAKGVLLQIIRFINVHRFVDVLEESVNPKCSDGVIKYCKNLTSRKKNNFKPSSFTYLGKEHMIDVFLMRKFNLSERTKVYSKIVIKGCLFASSRKINRRSCNYYAQLTADKRFIKIIDFLVDVDNNVELTTCNVLQTRLNEYCAIIEEVLTISGNVVAVQTKEIGTICIFIETDSGNYIIPLPNLLHY